mmetsp:Transcript_8202/g.19381  ORF Transcript_8202/g.19381 Transcript_8202/m.19381 type:complete len:149 (+) Transcript_8202:435-881(+)
MGAVLGYWLWNAAAWAYAYRVLGVEAERVLADRDHQGSVEVELHMKSFSPRGETRSPDLSEVKAKTEGRWSRGGGGGGTASSIDSPYDSPYRTPVEPRRVLVLPLVHVSALLLGRSEYSLWCRKSKGTSEFRRRVPSSSQPPGERRPG